MSYTFEDLWNDAETTMAPETQQCSLQEIIKELEAKLSIFNTVSQNTSMKEEDRLALKARVFGKIMIVLTKLTLKDNINVYSVLQTALKEVQLSIQENQFR